MPNNFWSAPAGPLMPGTSIAQTTFTAAQGLPVGETGSAAPMIFGNQLQPGSYIEVDAWGVASNTATPTIILGLYWGGTVSAAVSGTVLHALPTAVTTTTAMTAWTWRLTMLCRVLTVGTAGSIIAQGYWRWPTSLTAWTERIIPETAPAAVGSLNTTVNNNLVIGATWSASSASNSITCHAMKVLVHG